MLVHQQSVRTLEDLCQHVQLTPSDAALPRIDLAGVGQKQDFLPEACSTAFEGLLLSWPVWSRAPASAGENPKEPADG